MSLAVEDLAFGYAGKAVGEGASFTLAPGDVLCLLGPNGSGKTTLFKTVLGLLPPVAGRVLVDGEDTARWSPTRLAKVLGYVPQAHGAFFPFTVLEVVLMGRTAHLSLFQTPAARDVAVAEAALESLGIAHLRDAVYTRISGGERQLCLVARALAQEPAILVMDEPTASLDFGNQMRVLEQVRDLAARGLGVILSTHDPDHSFLVGDRVLMLRDGRLAGGGRPAEVVTDEALRRLYGVDVRVVAVPGHPGVRVCVPERGLRG